MLGLLAIIFIVILTLLWYSEHQKKELNNLKSEVTKIVLNAKDLDGKRVKLELKEKEKIDEFIDLLNHKSFFQPTECLCRGNPEVEFYKGDKLIYSIMIHHAISAWVVFGDGNSFEISTSHRKPLYKYFSDLGFASYKMNEEISNKENSE